MVNKIIKKWFISLVAIGYLCTNCTSPQSDQDVMLQYIMTGNKSAELGKFDLAKKEYDLALKVNPNSSTAKRNLGIVLVKLGAYKESASYLKEILRAYEKDSEVYYFLGESYRGLGLFTEALSSYETGLKLSPKDDRILKSIAWVYLNQNKPAQAIEFISDSYRQDPEDTQLILIISKSYVKLKKYNKALKMLKTFEESNYKLQSTNEKLAETEKILLLDVLGEAYFGLNNCIKSQKIFDIILNIRPFLATALMKSAKCDLKLNRIETAQMKLEKAQAAEPNNSEIFFWLGQVYASSDMQKSKFYYQRFLDRSENDHTHEAEIFRAQRAVSKAP